MHRSLCSPNVVFFLTTTSLLAAFIICDSVNPSQRYPYALSKCCERDGNPPPNGTFTASGGAPVDSCGGEGTEVVFLPREPFPAVSTDLELVEMELRNSVNEMKCDEGQDKLDILIELVHNETSFLDNERGRKGFTEVAFCGDNFLDPYGIIYSPRDFCVSSRATNKTHLAIKTCNQTSDLQSPCIPRCCGGPQSVLTSPPTSPKETLLDFCSTPSFGKNSWNPWTSNILRVDNQTRFYQRRHNPHIDEYQQKPEKHCRFHRVKLDDGRSLTLLEDGRLQWKQDNTTWVLDNFCLDGFYGEAGGNSSGDKRETPEDEEIVVVYICFDSLLSSPPFVSLTACSDFAHHPDQIIQLPQTLFPYSKFEGNETVPVELTTRENDGLVECPWVLTLDFKGSTEEYFDNDGRLVRSGFYYLPSLFCLQSVSQNALRLRLMCRVEVDTLVDVMMWTLAVTPPVLCHLAVAVVYILRKDKEPVFRCSIVAFSTFSILTYTFFLCSHFFTQYSFPHTAIRIIDILKFFVDQYASSWISVLCFDIWLTITFLRPGRKSTKRLRGYVAFTFTLTTVNTLLWTFERSKVRLVSAISLSFINVLLFLATAVKLWIAQHSSDIKNQKKTFLLYFKLFLLVGLRWVIKFLNFPFTQIESPLLVYLKFILLSLHPIVLFLVLVWDEETKRYLETNYPRVKRAIDFIAVIGYPVRKCWGLIRRCKQPNGPETSGNVAIEPPHCSTHMYVHTRRVHKVPK